MYNYTQRNCLFQCLKASNSLLNLPNPFLINTFPSIQIKSSMREARFNTVSFPNLLLRVLVTLSFKLRVFKYTYSEIIKLVVFLKFYICLSIYKKGDSIQNNRIIKRLCIYFVLHTGFYLGKIKTDRNLTEIKKKTSKVFAFNVLLL